MHKIFLTLASERLADTHQIMRGEAESPIWRSPTVREKPKAQP